ncbi:MAG: nucleotidyltransferase family protein [Pseudobdellovibrionaceae bacterium]
MGQKTDHFANLPWSVQTVLDLSINKVHPKKILLFGSRARNNARENSDYDIAFEIDDQFDSEWVDFLVDVDDKVYSLLPMDLINIKDLSGEYLMNLQKEGIVLYE